MLKIILDTNMYLSALIYGGMSQIILDCIAYNQLQLYVSSNLKAEVIKKFQQTKANKEVLEEVTYLMDYKGILFEPSVRITACRDPKDNFLLELAETAQADFIITRDKDLLELPNHSWKQTKIIKPEEFLPFLRSKKLID